ncbi:hypothetical protein ACH5RR_006660 [Cinchona calisaya]|uniref:Uncharacterized protein n=1 Tax=Cinchona calisaya TaxID=153742 RepID=A0ABD3APP1_9GENT
MNKLRHLHVTGMAVACSLPSGDLENSNKLHNLDTFSTVNVSLKQSLEEIVRKIPNICRLEIKLSQAKESFNRTLVLDSLSQLESLESLEVFPLNELLSHSIDYYFPSPLKDLTLNQLHLPWSKISLIEELPNLEVLKLLIDSFVGTRWDMKGRFPKLRFLSSVNLGVVEWTDTDCDGDCFPSLQKLLLIEVSLKVEILV